MSEGDGDQAGEFEIVKRCELEGGATGAGPLRLELHALVMSTLGALERRMAALFRDPAAAPLVIDRLFPPAHADPVQAAEHRRLLGDSMLERRRSGLAAFSALVQCAESEDRRWFRLAIPRDSIDLFLQVLNDWRLLLAVRLGMHKAGDRRLHRPRNPDARSLQDYEIAGYLESRIVSTMLG